MSERPGSNPTDDGGLDDTLNRQMNTTGTTGIMRALKEDKAKEEKKAKEGKDEAVDSDTEGESDEFFETTVVLPPDICP